MENQTVFELTPIETKGPMNAREVLNLLSKSTQYPPGRFHIPQSPSMVSYKLEPFSYKRANAEIMLLLQGETPLSAIWADDLGDIHEISMNSGLNAGSSHATIPKNRTHLCGVYSNNLPANGKDFYPLSIGARAWVILHQGTGQIWIKDEQNSPNNLFAKIYAIGE